MSLFDDLITYELCSRSPADNQWQLSQSITQMENKAAPVP